MCFWDTNSWVWFVYYGTGINNTDIFLLESGTIYSESKEKEASRFYIMQCSKTINEEVFEVPLQDLIKRFVLITIVWWLKFWRQGNGSLLCPAFRWSHVYSPYCSEKRTHAHTTALHINVTIESSYELFTNLWELNAILAFCFVIYKKNIIMQNVFG